VYIGIEIQFGGESQVNIRDDRIVRFVPFLSLHAVREKYLSELARHAE